jgi:hypothetical protein
MAAGPPFAVANSAALANSAAPFVPDTPAGRALRAWLAAFNSGNRTRIDSFDKAHYPWWPLDDEMAVRTHTAGYDLLSIDASGKLWITFHAREKSGASQIAGKLMLDSTHPELIWTLSLAPAAGNSPPIELDAAERKLVVERAAKLLDELYVFPDIGKRLAAALRSAEERGAYRDITDAQIFSWRLTDDLHAITHDEHLKVAFSPQVLPPQEGPSTGLGAAIEPAFRQDLLAGNCGFEKVEHLAPNIGYVKLDAFADPDVCAATAAAAMNFVANSDVLVIDLRDNHGGRPMVQFIASYLFAAPTHLNDMYWRRGNAVTEAWTLPYVPGKKFIGKPVFVLTSKRTFSEAEDFCYALKNLKRATLIGEVTGGGAHATEMRRLDDHLSIFVPFARFVSPITHTGWEGTGVQPDIEVPAADALTDALKRARDLIEKHPRRTPKPPLDWGVVPILNAPTR